MEAPCVRIERHRGEQIRRRLAERGLIARDLEITADDEWLYIPVRDTSEVPHDLTIVTRDVSVRDIQDTPADILGFEPSYERLGDIVLLDEEDQERAHKISEAIMKSAIPVKTILNRASKITGICRLREWDAIVGTDTETIHREYGCEFLLDVSKVYFSPRLATERHRVVSQTTPDERVFDMFAGVGPFVVPFAKNGATVVGVDVNERAIEYLRENVRRNGVEERVTTICGDVRDVVPEYEGWADRVVMNLPHEAHTFIKDALKLASQDCVIHYYDIQHEDDPFGPGKRAMYEAAEPAYEVTVETERVVRSYAPHEVNVCLDVRVIATNESPIRNP